MDFDTALDTFDIDLSYFDSRDNDHRVFTGMKLHPAPKEAHWAHFFNGKQSLRGPHSEKRAIIRHTGTEQAPSPEPVANPVIKPKVDKNRQNIMKALNRR
jgi:hypothetical protein